MTVCVAGPLLKEVLDEYAGLVAEKKVNKINYKAWQQLVKVAKEACTVDVNVRGSRVTVKVAEGDYIVIENSTLADLITTLNDNSVTIPAITTNKLNTYTTSQDTVTSLDATNLATGTLGCYNNYAATTAGTVGYTTTIGGTYFYPDKLYIKTDGEWYPIGDAKIFTTTTCEEKESMNMFKNFEFGNVTSDNVKMSMYGLCVKNKAGTYVAYDAKNSNMMDVDILNFDGKNFLYQIPVALDQIEVGMVIVHNRVPMFVVDVPRDRKSLDVIDPYAGERKEILPTRSPFGFDFIIRVVSLFDQFIGADKADAANPFGNMLPLMMLANTPKGENDMLPLMMMLGGNIDPMMAMVMANGDNSKDMLLPMMFMMNNQKQNHTCTCGGQCNGSHN